jgi:hypothetical protein
MEATTATIGLIPILIIVAVCWKTGVIATIKKTVDMANNEVSVQAASHKATVIKRAAELPDLDADTVAKAKANIAALNDFNL